MEGITQVTHSNHHRKKCFYVTRFVNCTAFGEASRAFVKELSEILTTEHPADKLTEYRHLWVDLSHMMQQLGLCFIVMLFSFESKTRSNR